MSLHQNGRCSQHLASNFKTQSCSTETTDMSTIPLAKWEAVNATCLQEGVPTSWGCRMFRGSMAATSSNTPWTINSLHMVYLVWSTGQHWVWAVNVIVQAAIQYVAAGSKGNQYKYPEGWDNNMKRSVRKWYWGAWKWHTEWTTRTKLQ